MGVFKDQTEQVLAVAPNRLFKAYLDGADFFTKVLPIKGVETSGGNGGPGTVQKVTYVGDTYMTFKVDSYDQSTLTYNYSIIDGEPIKDPIEKIDLENKIVASPSGGCIWKTTASYHLKGDIAVLPEDKLNDGREKGTAMFKAIEAYLVANPDAYN